MTKTILNSIYDTRGLVLRGFALCCAVFHAPALLAAERFAAPTPAEPITASPAGGLVQVTLSLLLVLAAVFAAAWAVRRLRGFGRAGADVIQIIAEVPLGQKERAVLVQVGQQQLLLGVAAGSVNTLHVLAEPLIPSPGSARDVMGMSSSTEGNANMPPQFKAILKRSLGL